MNCEQAIILVGGKIAGMGRYPSEVNPADGFAGVEAVDEHGRRASWHIRELEANSGAGLYHLIATRWAQRSYPEEA